MGGVVNTYQCFISASKNSAINLPFELLETIVAMALRVSKRAGDQRETRKLHDYWESREEGLDNLTERKLVIVDRAIAILIVGSYQSLG